MTEAPGTTDFAREAPLGRLGPVCRLGLASRGGPGLGKGDVLEAVRRGVNYLNWCGQTDGLSDAVRELGEARRRVFVATQLEARSAEGAREELDAQLLALGTTWIDVVTYYYVEHASEWDEITSSGGAARAIEAARGNGTVRMIGITSHQRGLAAAIAASGRVDLLMVRYNAAHRGAEEEVFPAAAAHRLSVIAFTALRWGALLEPTTADPPGFQPPAAPDCYRFVLGHPSVTVALMAPKSRRELEEDLTVLDDWRGLGASEYAALRAHGDRVRRHGGAFP
jgi:predicted aldo/keto reductase-like oxidoreductase